MIERVVTGDELHLRISEKLKLYEEALAKREKDELSSFVEGVWKEIKDSCEFILKYFPAGSSTYSLSIEEIKMYISEDNKEKPIDARIVRDGRNIPRQLLVSFGGFTAGLEIQQPEMPQRPMPGGLLDFDTLKGGNGGAPRGPRGRR